MFRVRGYLAFWIALSGCDVFAPGADPDSMSSAAHGKEAQLHEDEAAKHGASARPVGRAIPGASQADQPMDDEHRFQSEWHREHARQHAQAARQIEEIEASECADVPTSQRRFCPLSTAVGRFEATEFGITLEVGDEEQRERVIQRMRCHQAFGRRLGYPSMPGCPLYLPHADVGVAADGRIAVTTNDPSVTTPNKIQATVPLAQSQAE